MPIGTWRSGLYGNDGRYYPVGYYYPAAFYKNESMQIVRPSAKNDFNQNKNTKNTRNMYYEDTRFPKFHN